MWLLTSYLYLTAAGLSTYITGRLAGLKKDWTMHALMGLSILTTVMLSAALLGISAPDEELARFLLTLYYFSSLELLFGVLLLQATIIINYQPIRSFIRDSYFFKTNRKLILSITLFILISFSILLSAMFPISKEDIMKAPSGWWFRSSSGHWVLNVVIFVLIIISFMFISVLLKKIKMSKGFIKQEYHIALEFAILLLILLILYFITDLFFFLMDQEELRPLYMVINTMAGLTLSYYLFFIKHSSYRHAKYRLPRFFELMGDQAPAIAVIDLENHLFITSTKNFKRITRYPSPASKIITKSLFQFIKTTGKKYHHGRRTITFDDHFTLNERHYHIVLTKLPHVELYLLTLTDITHVETLNEKLQKYVSNFNLFLSTAFHELGNALQPIIGFTEILREELQDVLKTNALIADSLDTIERNIFRMKELLQLFRLIGKNQANFLDVNLEVLNFSRMVRELIKDYKSQAQVKNITLQARLPQKDVYVLGDTVYLPVVLVNIISNAIKYTPNGGKIILSLHDVPSSGNNNATTNATQMVCLEVTDTGIGIDDDEKEAILNPFKRGKTSRSAFNMGLGLHVANEIIKKHGGRLEIHSLGRNKGTTVKIYLIKAHA